MTEAMRKIVRDHLAAIEAAERAFRAAKPSNFEELDLKLSELKKPLAARAAAADWCNEIFELESGTLIAVLPNQVEVWLPEDRTKF